MSFSAAYRPPPPAPSAFFAIQLAQSSAAASTTTTSTISSSSTSTIAEVGVLPNPVSTPSAYLPRIPSKLSLHVNSQTQTVPVTQNVVTGGVVVGTIVSVTTAGGGGGGCGPSPSRNNSASSITALPSLSSSLNNLHTATSIEHLDVCGTRTAEADELLRRVIQGNVKRMSNSSMGPVRNNSTTAGFELHERSFTRYSDSESDDDDDDDDEDNEDGSAYYHGNRPSMGRRRSSGGSQPHGFNGPPQPSPLHSSLQSGAGRSGLIMNRSRKDRQARGVSAATFAF